MLGKLQYYWRELLGFLDIPGDAIMAAMSIAVIYQIFKGHDIGYGNAAAYASAVGAFAASNIGKKP